MTILRSSYTSIPKTNDTMIQMPTDLPTAAAANDVPAGFVEFRAKDGFIAHNGPLYARRDGTHLVMGFRVDHRHVNPRDVCHGGMLMTFADMQLPMAARFQAQLDDGFFPTINLTTDFLAPAPRGAWVEGRADVLRVTRNMVFMQGLITADGQPVARINGIFKRGGQLDPSAGISDVRRMFDAV